jgi:hypothetical protein
MAISSGGIQTHSVAFADGIGVASGGTRARLETSAFSIVSGGINLTAILTGFVDKADDLGSPFDSGRRSSSKTRDHDPGRAPELECAGRTHHGDNVRGVRVRYVFLSPVASTREDGPQQWQVQTDPELSDIVMRAFILRRAELVAQQLGDLLLLGSTHSADTLRIREFLSRNGHPHG